MGAIVGAKEWASLVGVIVGAIVGAKEWASLVGVLSGRRKNCVGEKIYGVLLLLLLLLFICLQKNVV